MTCPGCQKETPIGAGESVGFRDACDHCGADLHTCFSCVHHDPSAYNECKESNAERMLDRERANRCEYFRPGRGDASEDKSGKVAGNASGKDAKSEAMETLENLFKKD